YPFAELDRKKQEFKAKGKNLIDLSIGDPDLPTPEPIVQCLQEAAAKGANHRYPPYAGTTKLREAVTRWYLRRFGVRLDPFSEVLILIGSKEGIANIHYAFVDPGDIVLVPTPGYPVYPVATKFAGGIPYLMPLHKTNDFLPDLGILPDNIAQKAKIMHLNYPNNPTATAAPQTFFDGIVQYAKQHSIIVCHDAPYTEIYYDGHRPHSFLESKGAKEVGIEFHSLSKTFNMTGWRLGFAVGNADIIKGLSQIKMNVDSGQFGAVQEAGILALDHEEKLTPAIRHVYQERRDVFIEAMKKTGFKITPPKATFYLWAEVPPGQTSASCANHLLEEAGVVVTPGTAFGEAGEGFIRIALTAPKEKLEEAAERLVSLL
ncbi:MAG: LL-diaminopimelate aminotransferase, partial [bacterium]|nr:LL-diaminopimelate aminotransferase [bacterium]